MAPGRKVLHLQVACLVIALGSWQTLFLRAHTLGIHGLSGETPSGDPVLPEIRGPFQVELKARIYPDLGDPFFFFSPPPYYNLFEYSVAGNSDDIFFGLQRPHLMFGDFGGGARARARLDVMVEGTHYTCVTAELNSITYNDQYTYKFGVDATNTATIYQDGNPLVSCPMAPIPVDTPRDHNLKMGAHDVYEDVEPMIGAITGLQVKNLATLQHPAELFAFRNIPSQTFSSAFVASFYARFDSQIAFFDNTIFEFGNAATGDHIRCEQIAFSFDMACTIMDTAGTVHTVTAVDVITPEVFNFWHFRVATDGTMEIEKDGTEVARTQNTFNLPSTFRSSLLFGANFGEFNFLSGVLLGFRLDREITS